MLLKNTYILSLDHPTRQDNVSICFERQSDIAYANYIWILKIPSSQVGQLLQQQNASLRMTSNCLNLPHSLTCIN